MHQLKYIYILYINSVNYLYSKYNLQLIRHLKYDLLILLDNVWYNFFFSSVKMLYIERQGCQEAVCVYEAQMLSP